VLVALLLGSLMMLALLAMYAETLRATTASQNELIADQIGNSILAYCRTLSAGALAGLPTSSDLQINTNTSAANANFTTPEGLDEKTFTWQPSTISGEFTGTATVTKSISGAGYTTIAVAVTWSDSQKLISHTSTYSTNIYALGESNQ
jgi:Tfp pilus assembly protein PilV